MSEDIMSSQCILALDKLPIFPEVGGDVGVEVGVAVVQGECEGEEEPAETGENPWPVVIYFHCFVLSDCLTVFT